MARSNFQKEKKPGTQWQFPSHEWALQVNKSQEFLPVLMTQQSPSAVGLAYSSLGQRAARRLSSSMQTDLPRYQRGPHVAYQEMSLFFQLGENGGKQTNNQKSKNNNNKKLPFVYCDFLQLQHITAPTP